MKSAKIFIALLFGIPIGLVYTFSGMFLIMGYFMAPYGSMITDNPRWSTVASSWHYPMIGAIMLSIEAAAFFTWLLKV